MCSGSNTLLLAVKNFCLSKKIIKNCSWPQSFGPGRQELLLTVNNCSWPHRIALGLQELLLPGAILCSHEQFFAAKSNYMRLRAILGGQTPLAIAKGQYIITKLFQEDIFFNVGCPEPICGHLELISTGLPTAVSHAYSQG